MFRSFEREEEKRTFNSAFWRGFYVGLAAFVVLNVAAYFYSSFEYERSMHRWSGFSPASHFKWGFPFAWDGQDVLPYSDGVLNLLVFITFGFVFGFVFRYFRSR